MSNIDSTHDDQRDSHEENNANGFGRQANKGILAEAVARELLWVRKELCA